jgi:hypothetical protein
LRWASARLPRDGDFPVGPSVVTAYSLHTD